jgi:hypothetical protein
MKIAPTVEELLKMGLGMGKYGQRSSDAYLRGLFYLFEQANLLIPVEGSLSANPYKFEAFRSAVAGLLDRLRPSGEMVAPDLPDYPPDPNAAGALAALLAWQLVMTVENPTAEQLKSANVEAGTWSYAMPQARRDLGIANAKEARPSRTSQG